MDYIYGKLNFEVKTVDLPENVQYCQAYETVYRPVTTQVGYMIFDITLNKPIWWNGTAWTDAMGTVV